jgi:predicted Zn-dependent peptidase
MELLFGDTPAGWNVAGTEDNVRSFDRAQFIKYRSNNYLSSATTIVVAGSFKEEETLEQIKKAFSSIGSGSKSDKLPVIESQNSPMAKMDFKETDQTHMVIGVRTFPVTDEKIPAMYVLSTIMGRGMSSRLFSKMRDELGICYYIKTDHNAFTDHGILTISAGVDNSRVEEAVKGILFECERIKGELISEAEMKKAKDYIAGTTMLELETSDARAVFCGEQEVMKKKVDLPTEIIEKVNAVTAKEVQDLAKEVFVNHGLNMAIVGRFKDDDNFRSYFKFR